MDIAGVRVICSYIHDVYNLLELLRKQDDLAIVTVKDYIKNPKPNGYRSLHVIVRIPVYFLDKKEYIPVEVQLRTIAMDFWASLEHDLKYKAVSEVEVSTPTMSSRIAAASSRMSKRVCRYWPARWKWKE